MSPAGHCRADSTFRGSQGKARQAGALLTRPPIAEQCGVATPWSSSKAGAATVLFVPPPPPLQHPPRQCGSPPRLRQAAPGRSGLGSSASDRKYNSSVC